MCSQDEENMVLSDANENQIWYFEKSLYGKILEGNVRITYFTSLKVMKVDTIMF